MAKDSETGASDKIFAIDISFVVIGYNESENLEESLTAIQKAAMETLSTELIYVDGGSQDDSIIIARRANVDKILGGEKRRGAAENRNLGSKAAKGRYLQFVDGDMVMYPDWPTQAVAFLTTHEDSAAVCGRIKETNQSAFYQALQIDWSEKEGPITTCGGSAMWRRDVLEAMNGFPETVAYGEEPYLCWRVRNELGLKIHYLDRLMVDHDLNYSGFADYWRRNVRCGETYAEIASLCYKTQDRLWLKMTISNLVWSAVLVTALAIFLVSPLFLKAWIASFLFLILLRKILQMLNQKNKLTVSICYAVHAYFSKIPLALGECLWFLRRLKERVHQKP